MKLEEYLRGNFSRYIRPLFIKNECEVCKTTDNLELHHEIQFSELLNETLKELKLKYNDTEYYINQELKLINNIMLGKQVKLKYKTLCTRCHDKIIPNKYKPSIIKTILQNDKDITTMTIDKCINSNKAMKQLRKEFLNNEITLDELIFESMEIGYLHPNIYKRKD